MRLNFRKKIILVRKTRFGLVYIVYCNNISHKRAKCIFLAKLLNHCILKTKLNYRDEK